MIEIYCAYNLFKNVQIKLRSDGGTILAERSVGISTEYVKYQYILLLCFMYLEK